MTQDCVGRPTAVPTLRDDRVTLRAPVPADIDARQALGRQPEIVRMFGGEPDHSAPFSRDDALFWYDRLLVHPCAWVIEHQGRFIGEIRLDDLRSRERRATLAVGIFDPKRLGEGLGTAAVRLVLDHAFEALGLHRVGLRVLAYNTRAIRCYQKCGFVIEGGERQAALIDGVWHDDLIMGILAPEYRARQRRAQAPQAAGVTERDP